MIARIIIPLILIIILTDLYIGRRILPQVIKRRMRAWRTVWYFQSVAMIVYALALALQKDFAPADIDWLNHFLLLLGVWTLPKLAFTGCSILGWGHCVYHKTKPNWGNPIGIIIGIIIAATTVYGYTWGFNRVVVRHVTFASSDLPASFDGYRIVQFSDAHVGTYSRSRAHILIDAIDSINAQHPDMIAFTGDLQNISPSEIAAKRDILSRLHAHDGVYSILGNHDYAFYLDVDDATRRRLCSKVIQEQRRLGWTLLLNENRIIRRGSDSLVVAGMEYEGKNIRCPNRGDIRKTLGGIDRRSSFVLMLQHDPTNWQTNILPNSNAQLTLSGHTHAAQLRVFGWTPASLLYNQSDGMYYAGKRAINVSSGIGGLAPFRFWCPGEIVVITLKKK